MWHLSKKEIQDWLESKEKEFEDQDNINPHLKIKA